MQEIRDRGGPLFPRVRVRGVSKVTDLCSLVIVRLDRLANYHEERFDEAEDEEERTREWFLMSDAVEARAFVDRIRGKVGGSGT